MKTTRVVLSRILCVLLVCSLACLVRPAWAVESDLQTPETEEAEGAEQTNEQSNEEASEPEKTVTPAVIKKMAVTARLVGTDGVWSELKGLTLDEGSSAWDATRLALTSSDFTYRTGTTSAQDVLVSVTRTSDGTCLSLDPATGSGWHLYLNGERYLGSSSSKKLTDGDEIEWRFEIGTFMVSVSVVGPGGTGASYWIAPTSVRMEATQSAWDASRTVFEQSGYGEGRLFSYTTTDNGSVQLESLAALGENGITGESWQLFVNGALSESDAAHVQLHAGDSICWYYAGKGEFELPSFVAETGAASQNPAASVSIEGLVTQVWQKPVSQSNTYDVLDHLSGLAISGKTGAAALVGEDKGLIDPLSQLFGATDWHGSLSYALNEKISSGEGIRSAMGLDRCLYYLDDTGAVVKLTLE